MTTGLLRIVNFEDCYLASPNKRPEVKTVKWVALPTDNDSRGMVAMRLHFGDRWLEMFGAWMQLVKTAARYNKDGFLADSSGRPLAIQVLAEISRVPIKTLRELIEWATAERWIETEKTEDSDNPNGSEYKCNHAESKCMPTLRNVTVRNDTGRDGLYADSQGVTDHPSGDDPPPAKAAGHTKSPEPAVKASKVKQVHDAMVACWNDVAGRRGLPTARGGQRIKAKLRQYLRDPDMADVFTRDGLDRLFTNLDQAGWLIEQQWTFSDLFGNNSAGQPKILKLFEGGYRGKKTASQAMQEIQF